MPAVLVHGVPETTAVWGPLVTELARRDVVLLALPGFGNPLPAGFEPTMERYAAWLASELDDFEDVDLVAHDWGGLLALRVLSQQPTNIRSWAVDVADLADDFRWHRTARLWQTPGEGEAAMQRWIALDPADRAELLVASGAPADGALVMALSIDETMGAAILTLYRSAVEIGSSWGPGLDSIVARGLVIESSDDPFRSTHLAKRLAERTGAGRLELAGRGHWWMLEEPRGVARSLEEFWAAS